MIGLLLQLFWTFFLIGMFTFGGGYAVIGVVQSEIVATKGWISESAFTDIVAISQITPGPVGLNCSTYVGYEVLATAGAGPLLSTIGSLAASIAIVLPSFFIMLAVVKFYTRFSRTRTFRDVMSGLRPAVAGLIGAAALVLAFTFNPGGGDGPWVSVLTENFPDWKAWLLCAGAFCAYTFLKAGPLPLLAAGAVLGALLF